jgi:hypothetical protein
MDIETIKINNQLIPYFICAYNGVNYISSFNNNLNILFTNFIKGLLTFFVDNNKVLTVYAHNLAKFDGVFLLKHLIQFGNVEPLLFNGKLITIKLKFMVDAANELSKFNGKTIIFKDSLLLLPVSLSK